MGTQVKIKLNTEQDIVQSPDLYLQATGSKDRVAGGDGSTAGVHTRWAFKNALETHIPKGDFNAGTIGLNKSNDFVCLFRALYKEKFIARANLSQAPTRIGINGTRIWVYDVQVPTIGSDAITSIELRFEDIEQYDIIAQTILVNENPRAFLEAYTGQIRVSALNQLAFAVTIRATLTDLGGETFQDGTIRMESVTEEGSQEIVNCRGKFVQNPIGVEGPDGGAVNNNLIVDQTVIIYPKNVGSSRIMAENIKYVRFDYTDAFPIFIDIETYQNFVEGTDNAKGVNWQKIQVADEDFALTENDHVALSRLELPEWNVNANWPRFNQPGIPESNSAVVSIENYKRKWNPVMVGDTNVTDQNYIKAGVNLYLQNSSIDPSATVTFEVEQDANASENNQSQQKVSLQESLDFISLDYHIARMLGWGYVDAQVDESEKYVYLIAYDIPQGDALIRNFYMSLPTGREEERFPAPPVLKDITEYGLSVPGEGGDIHLTDENGYLPHDNKRYIRLFKEPDPINIDTLIDFFDTDEEFCLHEHTQSVFYGIEYKHESETNYRFPELSQDIEYTGLDGNPEVLPLPNTGSDRPIFIHEESETGVHHYALYGINWFSRTSALSAEKETDATQFPKVNVLLPPVDFQIQLIQEESTRILTTEKEQQRLESLGATDEILVRGFFNWTHINNMAYGRLFGLNISEQIKRQTAENTNGTYFVDDLEAELFFRERSAQIIQGKTGLILDNPENNEQSIVELSSLTASSSGETITPVVQAGEENRFIGALLVLDDQSYEVVRINVGDQLTATVKKIEDIDLRETPLNSDNFVPNRSLIAPKSDEIFMIIENLSSIENWPENEGDTTLTPGQTLMTAKVPIRMFTSRLREDSNGAVTDLTLSENSIVHREITLDIEGREQEFLIGGIFERATIQPIENEEEELAGFVEIIFEGLTKSNFEAMRPDQTTGPASLSNMEWSKGILRVEAIKLAGEDENPEKKRTIEVLSISEEIGTGNLRLVVLDPNYIRNHSNPNASFYSIKMGIGIPVNYHPGYRFYLVKQDGFDKAQILPGLNEEVKETFMTVRAVVKEIDISGSQPSACRSIIGTPIVMAAAELVKPESPQIPTGPLFATRPDIEGKSTYTFDTGVVVTENRAPEALVFYRTTEQGVLSQLYRASTVTTINEQLKNLPEEEAVFMADRWRGLLNVDIGDDNQFKVYPEATGTFRFPMPDNGKYVVPVITGNEAVKPFEFDINDANPPKPGDSDIKEFIVAAIRQSFLPLTEEPLIFRQMRTSHQTSSRKSKVKDINGRRLSPPTVYDDSSSEYDPSPMAVILPDTNTVRFTDYTLDGASSNLYFYMTAELSSNFEFAFGEGIWGPVRLINTYASEPPVIRKILAVLENPLDNVLPGVKLQVTPYLESDQISRMQIYRALKIEDAVSVRTMKPVFADPIPFTEEVIDTFDDLDFAPFGDSIYYRIIGLREVENEQNLIEGVSNPAYPQLPNNKDLAPTKPSKRVLASLVDVVNPEAPKVSFTHTEISSATPAIMRQIRLKWNKTAHNAIYFLEKMNSSGNWNLIETIEENDRFMFHEVGDLPKEDDNGNTIYHRYRVRVENSSGLLNLTENELTI